MLTLATVIFSSALVNTVYLSFLLVKLLTCRLIKLKDSWFCIT